MKGTITPLVRGTDVRILAASVLTGVLVAVVVAIFDALTVEVVYHWLLQQDLAAQAAAPVVGAVLAFMILRWLAFGAAGSTSDEYVRAFHDRHPSIPLREVPGKLMAGVATIGLGGAVGLEGPSIYAGSALGLGVHSRLGSWLQRDEARLLLTAGAAAGVAAVFKAPATGVMFAMEAPYRDDVTPQALLPSLLAAASSYATFVALVGTEPVIPLLEEDSASFLSVQAVDLLGALLLGVGAGLGGRGFAWLVRRAKGLGKQLPVGRRLAIGGASLAALAVVSDEAFGAPLTLGPGTDAMAWVVSDRTLQLIALLFVFRIAATCATLLAGGIGGLFIPLAALGVVMGEFVGTALGEAETTLYPILGLAAFLGAGYRAPIAAVMFVAESTGGVGSFVVPALVAAAVSQLVAGPASVADYQREHRLGHLERRFTLPLSSILSTDGLTVPPDATVSEFVYFHVLARREEVVPVVDGGRYLGLARLDDISDLDREDWERMTVREIMATELPSARPSWTLRDAVAAMEASGTDMLAVCDADGGFVGIVDADDIVKLDEILDETGA
ncbi:MAG: chloride channel protein [Acidimicrobiales bacterium]